MPGRLARRMNELAAQQAARHPGRFGSFAPMTLPDGDGAVAEAACALAELRGDSVVRLANAGGPHLENPLFLPLYAGLDRRAGVLLVHPDVPRRAGAARRHR